MTLASYFQSPSSVFCTDIRLGLATLGAESGLAKEATPFGSNFFDRAADEVAYDLIGCRLNRLIDWSETIAHHHRNRGLCGCGGLGFSCVQRPNETN